MPNILRKVINISMALAEEQVVQSIKIDLAIFVIGKIFNNLSINHLIPYLKYSYQYLFLICNLIFVQLQTIAVVSCGSREIIPSI